MPSPSIQPDSSRPLRRPHLRRRLALVFIGATAILVLVWQGPAWLAQARTGAAYGARMGCACRYVEGRDIAQCTADFEPGMTLVSLEDLPGERAVRASVPLLASRRATYADRSGCLLDP